MIADASAKSRIELLKFPSAISDSCDLPAVSVHSLEHLDNVLNEKKIRDELVWTPSVADVIT